jgi:hypothetical protein
MAHGAHLFGLTNVSQAGLKLLGVEAVVAMVVVALAAVVAVAAHKFFQCNVAWRSLP